jgi:hypothetical protein
MSRCPLSRQPSTTPDIPSSTERRVLVAVTRAICKQRAQPTQLLRPASVDLVSMTHVRSAKIRHTGCNESAQPAAWAPPPVLSDRNLAKVSAGLAWRRPPTERWQDKSRELRPVGRGRKHLSAHCSWTACHGTMRGARHCFDPKGDQKSKLSAARCAPRALCPTDRRAPSHDRLGRAARRTAVGPSRLALRATGTAGLRP